MDKPKDNLKDERPRFVTGGKPGPGRPKGSRNKLEEDFVADMVATWGVYGKQALETVAQKEPAKFAQIAASILPKHQTITRKVEQMSDRELADLLQAMNQKVMDATSERHERLTH